jgi:hypothetical protein
MSVVSMLLVAYVALSLLCSSVIYAACVVAKQAAVSPNVKRARQRSSPYRMLFSFSPPQVKLTKST